MENLPQTGQQEGHSDSITITDFEAREVTVWRSGLCFSIVIGKDNAGYMDAEITSITDSTGETVEVEQSGASSIAIDQVISDAVQVFSLAELARTTSSIGRRIKEQ